MSLSHPPECDYMNTTCMDVFLLLYSDIAWKVYVNTDHVIMPMFFFSYLI